MVLILSFKFAENSFFPEMLLNIVKLGSSNFGLFQIRPTEVPFLEVAPDMARSPKVSANFQQVFGRNSEIFGMIPFSDNF